MFTSTGKKQSRPAIAIFEPLSIPNQAIAIGAKAMIGIALPAMKYGISAVPSERKRASTSAARIAAEQPAAKPQRASWKVNQPAAHSVSRSSQKRAAISLGFGSRKRWTSKTSIASSQPTRIATRITSAGIQSRSAAADAARERAARRRDDDGAQCTPSPAGSGSPAATPAAEQLAHLGRELEEARLLARVGRARLRQVDLDDPRDPAGPRAHHDDARREEDRLGDRVGDEDDGRAAGLPDPQELEVEPLARHLVERAERLVHQQELRVERERPGDRDAHLHPARELPGMVVLEAGELDEVDHLPDALGAAAAVPAGELERERDVLRHGPPVVEHGLLEDHPVVAVEPRLVRGLPADVHRALRRLDEVGDHAEQRRLAAAGRPDQGDELARLELEVDLLQRGRAALLERLREPPIVTAAPALALMRRAPERVRTTSRSARTTTQKNVIPSAAATMFVAQSAAGSSE